MRRDFQVPCSSAEHNFERRWWWPHLGQAKVSQHAAAPNLAFFFVVERQGKWGTDVDDAILHEKCHRIDKVQIKVRGVGNYSWNSETPSNILCISDWKFYSFFMFSAIKWNQKFTNWFMRRHLSWYCVMFSYLWKQKARSADNVCDINPSPCPQFQDRASVSFPFTHYSCFYCLENCFSRKFLFLLACEYVP